VSYVTAGQYWAANPQGPTRRDAVALSLWVELAALERMPRNRQERRRVGRLTSLKMGYVGRGLRKKAHYTSLTLGRRERLVRKQEAALAAAFGEDQ
jgi:hypothetical protein